MAKPKQIAATLRRPYRNGVDVILTDGTRIEIRWSMSVDQKDDLRVMIEKGRELTKQDIFIRERE